MKLLALCILLAITPLADARSKAVRAHFQRLHPCPANGKKVGACPGYVVDHRIGLCVGGPDAIENLRWMTKAKAAAKDRWECKCDWEKKLAQCEAAGCFVAG